MHEFSLKGVQYFPEHWKMDARAEVRTNDVDSRFHFLFRHTAPLRHAPKRRAVSYKQVKSLLPSLKKRRIEAESDKRGGPPTTVRNINFVATLFYIRIHLIQPPSRNMDTPVLSALFKFKYRPTHEN